MEETIGMKGKSKWIYKKKEEEKKERRQKKKSIIKMSKLQKNEKRTQTKKCMKATRE